MKEIAWTALPFMEYFASLKIKLRPTKLISPDFPAGFSLSNEITKNDTVLEIGANVGGNTKELPKYAKQVYSFEPTVKSYKWLLRNTKGISNLKCFNFAVSDLTAYSKPFNVQFGGGSLVSNDDFLHRKQITVKVVGINDLPFPFNVIILDGEGAEVPILSAFRGFKHVDKIFCETHIIGGKLTLPETKKILSAHYENVLEVADGTGGRCSWIIARRN